MPLLTINPNGSVLTVNVNPNDTTSVETFPAASAPEPSSLALLVSALPAGLPVLRRPSRRAPARRGKNFSRVDVTSSVGDRYRGFPSRTWQRLG